MIVEQSRKQQKKRQRAGTNNSEKHGKQNKKGEAQKKQQQHAKKQQKKGKGRAQIPARSTESRTKRPRHRKNSSNTPKSNRKKAKGAHK